MLTLGLPVGLSVTSGFNAIAHAVEALYAQDSNPISSLMAEEGIRALAQGLPRVAGKPGDVAARSDCLYGAWLCGAVLGAVGMALHHKLCHVLGGTWNLPHAETHTIVLPHAIAYNYAAAPEAMKRIERAMESAHAAEGVLRSDEETSRSPRAQGHRHAGSRASTEPRILRRRRPISIRVLPIAPVSATCWTRHSTVDALRSLRARIGFARGRTAAKRRDKIRNARRRSMKLYYSPAACSLAPHIVAREAGYQLDLEKVDIPNKKTADGGDYWKINPKGYVPALQLDDGQVLTEVGVICQYLADQKPELQLVNSFGSMDRYREMEALNFVSAEIHKQIGALFNPKLTPEMKQVQLSVIERRLNDLEKLLQGKQFLAGDRFTVADAYLFTVLNWTNFHKIDLARWPNIKAFMARIAARPKVKEAMQAEGLLK